jgi:hypothetical protein
MAQRRTCLLHARSHARARIDNHDGGQRALIQFEGNHGTRFAVIKHAKLPAFKARNGFSSMVSDSERHDDEVRMIPEADICCQYPKCREPN